MEKKEKIFVEHMEAEQTKEIFVFTFSSGNEKYSFAAVPMMFKDITKCMNEQLTMYEKDYGSLLKSK
jgi:hypothetical protein